MTDYVQIFREELRKAVNPEKTRKDAGPVGADTGDNLNGGKSRGVDNVSIKRKSGESA